MIDRRAFLAGTGAVLLAAPLAAEGQQAGKVYRIGLIFMFVPASDLAGATDRAFLYALRDLGYVEGRNLVVERRTLEGRMERASAVVAEVVSLKVDLIVANNGFLTRVAKEATPSIPIVMVANATPV